MRRTLALLPLLAMCGGLISGCTIPDRADGTTVATAAPETPAAEATTAATAAPDATAATGPTAASTAESSTTSDENKTVVFAFDTFPTYFPGILMDAKGLMKQRGYELKLVPFLLDGKNNFSEEERYAKLASGEWDVLATTLEGFARYGDPDVGAVTTLIDESAGADKLVVRPEINTVNDLRGKKVAFSEGSVGEYFLYYAINLAGMTPNDITPESYETVSEAVQAFVDGKVDAVSAWNPDVIEAENNGGKVLVTSDKLRTIVDVLVTSRPALEKRTAAMQAFHDSWFEALRMMVDTPEDAGKTITEWGNNDWTFVTKPDDLQAQLSNLAQATLGSNQIAFKSPDVLVERMQEANRIWQLSGSARGEVSDFKPFVDSSFVLGSAAQGQLFSTKPPVNSSFLLASRVEAPSLNPQTADASQSVAQLPLDRIDFEPETTRLTPEAAEALTTQVLPVLRNSRLYLQIKGSSAWPGPEGRYSKEEIMQFARDRALAVASFLTQQGIDPNRLVVDVLEPKHPNSLSEQEMIEDRVVRFVLIGGGR